MIRHTVSMTVLLTGLILSAPAVPARADSGDVRIDGSSTVYPITEAVAEVARAQREGGRLPADIDDRATAAVLVAMLANVAGHQYGIEAYGTTPAQIQRSLARLVYSGLTGAKPPS